MRAVKIRVGLGLGTRTLTNEQESFGSFVDDAGAPRFRLAVAVRAHHRRGARSGRRDGVRRRAHDPHQVRDERDGAARAQPGARGQGAGQPRPALGRPAAARLRPRRRRPPGAAGLRRRAEATGPDLQRGPPPAAPAVERGRRRPRRRVVPAPRRHRAAEARPAAHGRVARRAGAVGAPAGRPAGRRVAPVVLRRRRRTPGHPGSSRRRPPRPTGPSTPSTTARSWPTPRRCPTSWWRSSPSAGPTSRIRTRSSRRASPACASAWRRWWTPGPASSSCCPLVEPQDWTAELEALATEVLPLQD